MRVGRDLVCVAPCRFLARVRGARLVTLVGVGGVGPSRAGERPGPSCIAIHIALLGKIDFEQRAAEPKRARRLDLGLRGGPVGSGMPSGTDTLDCEGPDL